VLPRANQSTEKTFEKRLWWRSQPHGRSAAREEFNKLPMDVQTELDARTQRLQNGLSRRQDVKSLGDGIMEVRYNYRNNPYRLLYMKWGRFLVVLTVFHKKDEKTDKRLALQRKKTWIRTFGAEPPPSSK
jgi:phage-related protein